MKNGKLIVFEGACDGIGKTTLTNLLYDDLKSDNLNVFRHHFPSYGTYQAKPVEEYLKGNFGEISKLSPYFINSLYALDRAITWQNTLKKEYEKGNVLLLDRYTTSSLIYQSALIENIEEKKKFIDYVCDFEYQKLGIQKPDLVLFLYASFDLVTSLRYKRKTNDGITNDIHERDLAYMKKVYDNAMFVADYLSWQKVKCDEDFKMRSIDSLRQEIYSLVKKLK